MMRSRLVLPEPEGPSRATSSPVGTVRLTSFTATKEPKDFVTLRTSIDIVEPLRAAPAARHASSTAPACLPRHSTSVFATRVTRARKASREATANAAWKLYSL